MLTWRMELTLVSRMVEYWYKIQSMFYLGELILLSVDYKEIDDSDNDQVVPAKCLTL